MDTRATVLSRFSYANVTATIALFIALGGTSYAVLRVDSNAVIDNSLRSRDLRDNTVRGKDVRNRTIMARDVKRDGLGGRVIKEHALGVVPNAADADRLGGASLQELRVQCPTDTVARAGVCVENSARSPLGFFGAIATCDAAGRGLPTMPQLDAYTRSGRLAQPEWTASVYRNPANGPNPFDELETVVLSDGGVVGYERVYLAVQHAFRCVALPSN